MFHLINTAYAESAATGTAGGGLSSSLLMIIIMVVVFYFLLIRPENKRKKEAESMRSSLKKGDYITTIGGVYGRVVAVTDRTVVIETRLPPSSVPPVRARKRRSPLRTPWPRRLRLPT